MTGEPMHLDCPACGRLHVDRDGWEHIPHRTHRCEYCGHEWRPFPYATVGIATAWEQLTSLDQWRELAIVAAIIWAFALLAAVLLYFQPWGTSI